MRIRRVSMIARIAVVLFTTVLVNSCTDGTRLRFIDYAVTSVNLSGAAVISVGNPPSSVVYTASVNIIRSPNFKDDVTLIVWLFREPESVYPTNAALSWTKLTIPANQQTGNATLTLGCPGNSVVGTAITLPDGSGNSIGSPWPGPDSRVGGTDIWGNPLPAHIHATVNEADSNTIFVRCTNR